MLNGASTEAIQKSVVGCFLQQNYEEVGNVKQLAVLFAVAGMLCLASFAQNENEQREEQSDQDQKTSIRQRTTNIELAQFDQFLDAHAQIRRELSKNPKLID